MSKKQRKEREKKSKVFFQKEKKKTQRVNTVRVTTVSDDIPRSPIKVAHFKINVTMKIVRYVMTLNFLVL